MSAVSAVALFFSLLAVTCSFISFRQASEARARMRTAMTLRAEAVDVAKRAAGVTARYRAALTAIARMDESKAGAAELMASTARQSLGPELSAAEVADDGRG